MRKLIVFLICALALVACGSGTPTGQEAPEAPTLVAKELNDYTWEELTEISRQVAAAESDEAGYAVAQSFGLVNDDGTLTDQRKQIVIDDTRAIDVRLAGIRHDDRSDGLGKAGLSFVTVGAIELRPMNSHGSCAGGWAATELRYWLVNEMPLRLDEDLQKAIVPVLKYTNNVGKTDDAGSVTTTIDALWCLSVKEVCGDVAWDADEFHGRYRDVNVDAILNAEGTQYQLFAQQGVNGSTDAAGALSLAESTGPTTWWYRTPYPFGYGQLDSGDYWYQVMAAGYPEGIGVPSEQSGVVVGFCV